MKNKTKKVMSVGMGALMAFAMLIGCGKATETKQDTGVSGKVVVNIEGTITAVNGDEITLDSGKVLVISEDTVFAGDVDTNNQVSDKIGVGNFIQGYTSDDPSADKVTADKIYSNVAPQRTGGKLVINFEGTIASIADNRIILDNGQVVILSESTIITDVNGTVENATLAEGGYIQGYTANDPAAAEITAQRVHIVTY